MIGTPTYDRITQVLHWLLAILILFLIYYHPSTEEGHESSDPLTMSIHITLGFLVLFLVIGRLIWRIGYARIPPEPRGEQWEIRIRQITYLLFYVFMLLAPILGVIVSFATDIEVSAFGVLDLPQLINNESQHGALRSLHGFGADVLLYLGLLHIGAALYHQFWLKDGLMKRMLK